MNNTVKLVSLGIAALFVAGCATPIEEKTAPIAEASAPAPAPAPTPAPDNRTVARVEPAPAKAIDPLADPSSPLAKRSVFFDFDSFVVKADYQSLVEAHGRFLVANKQRRIVIEGNADERGSREYNLALGQKRAEAVKSRLALLGVGDNQIEAVSFGEERPRNAGHDETAWAENRRADIVYR
jgi:peptidoglycan-associated lipoprotein